MYAALISSGMKLLEPCIQQHCYDGFVPKGGTVLTMEITLLFVTRARQDIYLASYHNW